MERQKSLDLLKIIYLDNFNKNYTKEKEYIKLLLNKIN